MFCRKCGTKLREGTAFCHKCGHPWSTERKLREQSVNLSEEEKEKYIRSFEKKTELINTIPLQKERNTEEEFQNLFSEAGDL